MRCFTNAAVSVLAVLLMTACKGHYSIQGTVDAFGYEGCSMFLVEYTANGVSIIDSCKVHHSAFRMDGSLDSVRFVMLCKDNTPVLPMYLEKGKTSIVISPTEGYASGTRQNDLFYSFLKEKNRIDNRFDDMMQRQLQLVQADVIDSDELQGVRDSLSDIVRECEDLIASFILDNSKESVAVGVFSMLLGPADQMSPLVRRILDSAPKSFFKNPTVADYAAKAGYRR